MFQAKFTAAMAGDYQCTAKTDDHSAIDVAVVVVKPCRGDQFMCSDMVSDHSDQLMYFDHFGIHMFTYFFGRLVSTRRHGSATEVGIVPKARMKIIAHVQTAQRWSAETETAKNFA